MLQNLLGSRSCSIRRCQLSYEYVSACASSYDRQWQHASQSCNSAGTCVSYRCDRTDSSREACTRHHSEVLRQTLRQKLCRVAFATGQKLSPPMSATPKLCAKDERRHYYDDCFYFKRFFVSFFFWGGGSTRGKISWLPVLASVNLSLHMALHQLIYAVYYSNIYLTLWCTVHVPTSGDKRCWRQGATYVIFSR